ncbi:MAG TPA: FAD-binding oxidoreductase, partial [Longimicrobiales bacterium]|nr:FAD-binding oxidoreductase [Longimicrobiales bacterium]
MKRRTFVRSAVATAAVMLPGRPLLGDLLPGYTSLVVGHRQWRDVEAVTGDGKPVTLSDAAIAALRTRLRGAVLLAGEDGYDSARMILNPSFDKRPALIVQPTGVADVRTAVTFAREHGGLLLAVKCGGHSFSGASTCDRGMMIDLSRFRDVHVDPAARRVRVTGGSLLGAVDHEAMAFGQVTPLGTVSHTGVGGLVTGGGFGRLARRFGLSIDNLLSVDVVSADGSFLHASAEQNPDLFWGVRGGGGNFGIVTSFEFRLHPMERQVMAGEVVFPLARARDVLVMMSEYAYGAPDELTLGFAMVKPPGDEPGVAIVEVCWSGDPGRTEQVLAPVRKLGGVIADTVGPTDYTALQRSGDVTDPRAMGLYLKGGFILGLRPELITRMVDEFRPDPRRQTLTFFQLSGGAIARVAPEATAFVQRDAFANLLTAVGWRFGEDPAEHIAAARAYWSRLEPFTHG